MESNKIKEILKKHLESPENENFNNLIIEKLDIKQKKKHSVLFNEKSILYWFLIISGFVLFFYLQQESNIDKNAISVACIICTIPIYLMIFNKIYTLKQNTQ